jgi:glutathionylspermidine synthase
MAEEEKMELFRQTRLKAYEGMEYFWADLFDKEYALYDMVYFSKKEIEDIRDATNAAGQIFYKTAKLLRNSPDSTLQQLDIPEKMIPFIRHQGLPVESVIARIDLAKTPEGYKVLELNSDTPTFEKEVFRVNGYMTNLFGVQDPNEGLEKELASSVRKAIHESAIKLNKTDPYIVFTSHDDHIEDYYTTLYLLELADLPARYVPLHQLNIISGEGLFDDEGQKIDILYRPTYPIEHLIEDRDQETQELVGIQLLELVRDKKIAMINPISAFLLQSKAVQSVIWGLMEIDHPFYSADEKETIKRYFLPTYLEEDIFISKGIQYVKKPCFGREGDTVEIYKDQRKIMEDKYKTYISSTPVFQQYVDLPSHPIQTTEGIKEGKLLIGSFLVNGKASGIGIRAGNQITDNTAYYLPLGIK